MKTWFAFVSCAPEPGGENGERDASVGVVVGGWGVEGTYVEPYTAGLETDDEHLRLARGRLEARDGLVALLDVHGAVEAEPGEALALEDGLDEVEEGGELGEDDCAEAGVLVPQTACDGA